MKAIIVLATAAVLLVGCADGSSSGNYHKTFRPHPSVVDSAD